MKQQEVIRCSLKKLREIEGFKFVWFTDGLGWQSARENLRETFDIMEHIYNIDDLENNIISQVIV